MEKLLRPDDITKLLNLKSHETHVLRMLYPGFPPPVAERSTAKKKLYRQAEIEAWAKQVSIPACIREGYRVKNRKQQAINAKRRAERVEPPKLNYEEALFRDLLSGKLRPEGYVPKRIY